MEPFKRIDAVGLPIASPNVDTDQIVPARYLWHPKSDGYGQWLFNDLRFSEDGKEKPDFGLNQPRYAGAKVLVADRNFAGRQGRGARTHLVSPAMAAAAAIAGHFVDVREMMEGA